MMVILARKFALFLLVALISAHFFVAVAEAQASPLSRPVLFVHGWCGNTAGWDALHSNLAIRLNQSFPTLYPKPGTPYPTPDPSIYYEVYYDGTTVNFLQRDSNDNPLPVPEASIPISARYFLMHFYDPDSGTWSPSFAAQVSIFNKGDELAHVLREITKITRIEDVIVIAHSLGGLVARAYLEQIASPSASACYEENGPNDGGAPNYSNGLCNPGGTTYQGEVAQLITIDTPHGGTDLAQTNDGFLNELFPSCEGEAATTKIEMIPGSQFLQTLNYNDKTIASPQTIPSQVEVQSLESYFNDGSPLWDLVVGGPNDAIVSQNNQSMEYNLNPDFKDGGQFGDWTNPYSVESIQTQTACQVNGSVSGVLHLIECVGSQPNTQGLVYAIVKPLVAGVEDGITVQTFLDGAQWNKSVSYDLYGPNAEVHQGAAEAQFPGVTPGQWTIVNVVGPSANYTVSPSTTQTIGWDSVSHANNWTVVFRINFTSIPPAEPVVATLPASPVYTNDAIFNGTVNPEGAATNVWFEWGTDSQLSQYKTTPQQSIPSGTTPVSVTFDQGELSASSIYYYRIAANNGGTTQKDAPVGFVTLAALPSPSLLTPANGSAGVNPVPTFSWNTVSGASSYRILVATSPAELPTDPSSSTCGIGCVLSATLPGATYTPASGILYGSTTYYWEVSATGSGQNGNWSGIFSFSTSSSAGNDFSLQVTPNSQSVNGSGTVGYAISTTTTSGASQTIELGVGNFPTGVTALFTPNLITSGSTAIVGLTTSAPTPVGTYSITIAAIGSSTTHTATVTLVVTNNTGTPGVSFSPPSLAFSNQTQYTTGPSQLVTYTNTGTAPLQVLAIVGDSNFVVQSPCINTLPPGTSCTFSVASDPSITGPMTGTASLYFVGTGSPAVLPLRGYGVAPSPTTGTIQVNGTLNGIALPATYGFNYTLTGPATYTGLVPQTFTVTPGTYTLSFNGFPSYLTLSGITPSATQAVAAGGVIAYTMNFTAPDDFYAPYFGTPPGGGWTAQFVPAGNAGTYYVDAPVLPGNASTPLTLQVFGNPSNDAASFNPQPMYSGASSTLTITTNSADAIGAYTLSLKATNPSGLSHAGTDTSALVITAPPSQPLQLASENSSGVQGNAASSITAGSISADGRYVVFNSAATNLASNIFPGVFVRDMQAGTTTLVSVSSSGVPADLDSGSGSISAYGRYVVFSSTADNLASGTIAGNNSIYLRDLQQGTTEREDVAADGTPGNGTAFQSTISADGRFVVFSSTATNLVPGVSGNYQLYLRDRNTGQIKLVSVGMDGSPANQGASAPVVSADGRFVAYFSSSTNLVSQTTGGLREVYVYDTQAAQTVLASSAPDGTPANQAVSSINGPPTMSADGRFVSFTSSATNLISGVIDFNNDSRVFLKDLTSQTIRLVDTDANSVPLAVGGQVPQISADGRFIAYILYDQVFLRDMESNQSVTVSLAANGTPGNNYSFDQGYPPNINSSGTTLAFQSNATNLIPNDTNSASDVFVGPNPLIGTPYVQSLTLSRSPAPGGSTITGTVTLTGSAPANGATVVFSSNNTAAQVPSFVFVPAGATTAAFSFDTSLVATETVMTVIASYNGASTVALLTLEPAPTLSVAPSSGDFGNQAVGTTSPSNAFTITNTGTAPLTLNSESIASGQVFHVAANSCGATVAVGANCSVSVVFSPTAAGPTADTLQINYSSSPVLQSVPLTGTGTTPFVSLAPTTVNFGSQPIPSATPATVTLTNVGTAPLTSIAASITGANTTDFSISSDGCSGTVLQPNSGCLITVVFSPQAAGPQTATLSVNDNAAGSPQAVWLSGTGSGLPLTVSPTALSYGNQGTSSTSAAKKVTLTNNTGAVVTMSSTVISGTDPADFTQSATTCGKTLALKKSCTLSITFTPTALGARSAMLILTDSAVNSPQTVALSGTGVLQVSLSPTALAFGNQADGSSSAPKSVTLTNNTSTALPISSVATTGTNSGEFAVSSNTCGASVGGHSSCKISVTFAPVTPGAKTASLTITDSANNSPQSVSLTGTGIAPVSVTPSSLTFAAQTVGTTSPAKKITVKNNLKTTLTFSGITVTGANAGDFAQSETTCGGTLGAGLTCTVSITFTPTAKGSRVATLNISDSAITSPQTVALSGTGK
jgi:pimeloyl-ACP methyl ester carboxylesterase